MTGTDGLIQIPTATGLTISVEPNVRHVARWQSALTTSAAELFEDAALIRHRFVAVIDDEVESVPGYTAPPEITDEEITSTFQRLANGVPARLRRRNRAEPILGIVEVEEFPVQAYGLHTEWSIVFDACSTAPHDEHGSMLESMLRATEVPRSLASGSVFYISSFSTHPALVGNVELPLLRHVVGRLSLARGGIIIADPAVNWRPTLASPKLTAPGAAVANNSAFAAALGRAGFRSPSTAQARSVAPTAVFRSLRRPRGRSHR